MLYGKPIIKNTHISVDLVLEKLAVGDKFEYILDAYPNITEKDIYVCLMFEAFSIKNEIVYSIAS